MNNLCLSVKNKYSNIQCPHKRKANSEYCGVHLRSKNIKKFIDGNKNIKMGISKKKVENVIYPSELFQQDLPLNRFTITSLKYTIKYLHLNDLISLQNSKQFLYNKLRWYYNIIDNVDKIIKIQSVYRRFLVRISYGPGFLQKKKCVNDEDFFTFENKYEIDNDYFYSYCDKNGFIYCFDICSLNELLKKSDKNPYTRNKIPKSVYRYVNIKKNILKKKGISVDIPQPKLSPEKEYENKVFTIFQGFDELGNYTDMSWFTNLDLVDLKKLYNVAEDIWNYRAELDIYKKKRILLDGVAFRYDKTMIHNLSNIPKNKRILQNILLDEFKRFITEGVNRDEKILGALLMLTAIVEVSPSAAQALPHLVQYTD